MRLANAVVILLTFTN